MSKVRLSRGVFEKSWKEGEIGRKGRIDGYGEDREGLVALSIASSNKLGIFGPKGVSVEVKEGEEGTNGK